VNVPKIWKSDLASTIIVTIKLHIILIMLNEHVNIC